ncbi:hypothetical protein [Kallotenue papyrolyticum]|uniref:hypothetical protein n=1 Tax=Kallotenue papyrolyticum TaxID=1325125 RepID=UPI000492760B|nr:hypothetical protein [Kallotenue papyrolyticum]
MPELVREPLGLRVLVRARRPEDGVVFRLWRAELLPELDELLARGEHDDRARLWAALLRWHAAAAVVNELQLGGWRCTLHGVRAIALGRAVALLQPPHETTGWTLTVAGIALRAVPEETEAEDASLARLLRFLERSSRG